MTNQPIPQPKWPNVPYPTTFIGVVSKYDIYFDGDFVRIQSGGCASQCSVYSLVYIRALSTPYNKAIVALIDAHLARSQPVEATEGPRHSHNCQYCNFLDRLHDWDLYLCTVNVNEPYWAICRDMAICGDDNDHRPAIIEARRRAIALGLIPGETPAPSPAPKPEAKAEDQAPAMETPEEVAERVVYKEDTEARSIVADIIRERDAAHAQAHAAALRDARNQALAEAAEMAWAADKSTHPSDLAETFAAMAKGGE